MEGAYMKMRVHLLIIAIIFMATACSKSEESQQPPAPKPILNDMMYKQVFTELLLSSKNWAKIPEGDKTKAVQEIMNLYQERENSAMLKPADFYVKKIDDAATLGTFPIDAPLPTLIKFFAVMEYDFYNGQDKDELAKTVLGDKIYAITQAKRRQESAAAPKLA